MKNDYFRDFWNGVRLEGEKRVDLEIMDEKVTTGMTEKEINSMEWVNVEEK